MMMMMMMITMMTALVTVMCVFVHLACGTRWIELSNMELEKMMNDQFVQLLTMTHLLRGRSGLLKHNMCVLYAECQTVNLLAASAPVTGCVIASGRRPQAGEASVCTADWPLYLQSEARRLSSLLSVPGLGCRCKWGIAPWLP